MQILCCSFLVANLENAFAEHFSKSSSLLPPFFHIPSGVLKIILTLYLGCSACIVVPI